jgi:hypothetical protein
MMKKTKDNDLPFHTIDPRGRGALWCSVDRQGLSVGTAAAATVVLGQHSGMQVTYIDCSLLVATNNLIFCISCAMPADTNNP